MGNVICLCSKLDVSGGLGMLREALGGFGRFWKALGSFGEALGGFGRL